MRVTQAFDENNLSYCCFRKGKIAQNRVSPIFNLLCNDCSPFPPYACVALILIDGEKKLIFEKRL